MKTARRNQMAKTAISIRPLLKNQRLIIAFAT
jgi:hypothetical protein